MMTKEEFCEIIDLIKKQIEMEDKFDEGMQMAFPDSYPPLLPNGILWGALIKTLQIAIGDKYEYVDWWINEDCMKGELSVYDENNVEYRFDTPEKLYDFIINNN